MLRCRTRLLPSGSKGQFRPQQQLRKGTHKGAYTKSRPRLPLCDLHHRRTVRSGAHQLWPADSPPAHTRKDQPMSKTKTLVLAVSVLTSLAATGLSAGSAQAQTSSGRVSIAVGELNSALDRAEYTGFRGGFG